MLVIIIIVVVVLLKFLELERKIDSCELVLCHMNCNVLDGGYSFSSVLSFGFYLDCNELG